MWGEHDRIRRAGLERFQRANEAGRDAQRDAGKIPPGQTREENVRDFQRINAQDRERVRREKESTRNR